MKKSDKKSGAKNTKLYGKITSSAGVVYTNDFFGFKLSIPNDWPMIVNKEMLFVQRQIKTILEESGEDIDIDSESFKYYIGLFRASRYLEQTSGVEDNPNITCTAQNMVVYPSIKNGKDFIEDLLITITSGMFGVPYEILKVPYREALGGETLDILEMRGDFSGSFVYTKYYCVFIKGYALSFITTCQTPEGSEELNRIMSSLLFC